MPLPTKAAAVVFDLDGTLIDSADDLGAAANRLLASEGRRPLTPHEVRRFIGDGSRVFVDRAWAATGTPADGSGGSQGLDALVARFIAEYQSDVAGHTRAYAGAVDTVAALKAAGIAVAVCTNKPQRPAELVLEALGFAPYVDAVAGGDRFAHRKPDPRHLLDTLALLGASPEAAVMVGDNEHDMAVAHGAGTGAVLVSYGYARLPLEEIEADARIDSLTDLPGLLGL
ncbi:phosphoglycolate phosphatase [Thalassobaculum salexigens]|uniref:phosphoglycolate phosphatase n=1 Tax=Thalassobaculum salexigens TaxID=455360 RepID=UPI0004126145|nr:phosphoglycolate phosphatase [Thalassobaculum salexigens]